MKSKEVSALCLSVRHVRQATNDLLIKRMDECRDAGLLDWGDSQVIELRRVLDKLQDCETALEQLQKEVWSSEDSDE